MELVALLNERTHSARYRGHGYVPLSFRGEGGGGGEGGRSVVMRMVTQRQQQLYVVALSCEDEHNVF